MKLILLVLLSISIACISCKKEESNYTPMTPVTNPIIGTWELVSIDAQTQSSREAKAGPFKQRTESTLNYVTENNIGELIITDSNINKTGLAYIISSQMQTDTYIKDILTDSRLKPYNATYIEPAAACDYKILGDSISFPQGGFIKFSVSTLEADPLIAGIHISGDTLTFKEHVYTDSTETRLGVNYRTIKTGTSTITFLKRTLCK